MELFLIILLFPAALIAYLLFIPVTIYLRIGIDGRISRSLWIKLFPFKFKIENKLSGPNKIKGRPDWQKRRKREKIPLYKRVNIFQTAVDEFETIKDILSALVKFIAHLFKTPDKNFLNITLRGGFKEPDITGIFYGFTETLEIVTGNSVSLKYHPDFFANGLSGNIVLGTVTHNYKILRELFVFLWKLPKLQIFKLYKKSR